MCTADIMYIPKIIWKIVLKCIIINETHLSKLVSTNQWFPFRLIIVLITVFCGDVGSFRCCSTWEESIANYNTSVPHQANVLFEILPQSKCNEWDLLDFVLGFFVLAKFVLNEHIGGQFGGPVYLHVLNLFPGQLEVLNGLSACPRWRIFIFNRKEVLVGLAQSIPINQNMWYIYIHIYTSIYRARSQKTVKNFSNGVFACDWLLALLYIEMKKRPINTERFNIHGKLLFRFTHLICFIGWFPLRSHVFHFEWKFS